MLRRSKGLAILIAVSLFLFVAAAYTLNFSTEKLLAQEMGETLVPELAKKEEKRKPAPVVYGIPTDSLAIVEGSVKRGESLSELLSQYNITAPTVYELAKRSKDVFNVRRIAANRDYTVLHALDSARTAQYFIYEPNQVEYVVYDLRDSLNVTLVQRKVEVLERTIAGEIESSLFESMVEAGGSPQLVNKFADIYAWRLNLNRIQPGDQFKLIYEEKVVNGETIGYGELKAAFFEHSGEPIYAIGFDQGNGTTYYDQEGKSLKRAFLKEPLEYTRISSRYSKRRFHPVQKRYKAHLGTDFAAPRGTPIRTVGDGVVLDARYTRGNGYFVKIRHNKTYTTQYLHMSKFARGIRRGVHVKQGQTIGYVGSTGLATGPHLCYRFWKNGRQVDALKVKLPAAEPIRKEQEATFTALKEQTVKRMEAINLSGKQEELLANRRTKQPSDA
ncbi:murein DD-endopeptidase MepM/ murein hydrolase activator NlpD [Pontibacter ummariensis]|uniref:Murein DD-endopeptidase MepM and murein hydrolase activator NlpD, contain LysM domain n=1 Tax=Pontibacter ummariensis TaxID=1610492 RepID=A0A239D5Y1_9BACT|nr:peptidoglycan DD-metalloendopeptidase family protein [Pontibacter ummariensis]PRY14263.1 murein DD-endopeptidase MepM/ murein hydrolase activator NlpD [Pontibacter ummariensis]SNS27679.1 Murein DD-endopeptidase MepM and murein hydrolase activator NlpD, contain LysM domain [Pontibacter ummariensis]